MIKKLLLFSAIGSLVLPFIHPFGPVRRQSTATALSPELLPLLERACRNCHSERTVWPLYSYLPFVSWAIEKDVADARREMNLSLWGQYTAEQRRQFLARMGTEVRNRRMPLARYVLLHPEARLTEAEIKSVYEWTKAQRRALRNDGE